MSVVLTIAESSATHQCHPWLSTAHSTANHALWCCPVLWDSNSGPTNPARPQFCNHQKQFPSTGSERIPKEMDGRWKVISFFKTEMDGSSRDE